MAKKSAAKKKSKPAIIPAVMPAEEPADPCAEGHTWDQDNDGEFCTVCKADKSVIDAEGKTPRKKAAKKATKPPAEPKPKKALSPIPVGKLGMRRDPRLYAAEVSRTPEKHKRIVGLDLGTNCGIAFCDIMPGFAVKTARITMGQWDLSVGPYDTGPLRHVRLRHFLSVLQPDLVHFEDVKYDVPLAALAHIASVEARIAATVARVVPTAEFIGGLKATVASWCEERCIPCQGVAITQIKQYATGRGNASKVEMIEAANRRLGAGLDPEDYERTGTDNIADAAFLCMMGVDLYAEGLDGDTPWVGSPGEASADGNGYAAGADVSCGEGPPGASATGDIHSVVPAPG